MTLYILAQSLWWEKFVLLMSKPYRRGSSKKIHPVHCNHFSGLLVFPVLGQLQCGGRTHKLKLNKKLAQGGIISMKTFIRWGLVLWFKAWRLLRWRGRLWQRFPLCWRSCLRERQLRWRWLWQDCMIKRRYIVKINIFLSNCQDIPTLSGGKHKPWLWQDW